MIRRWNNRPSRKQHKGFDPSSNIDITLEKFKASIIMNLVIRQAFRHKTTALKAYGSIKAFNQIRSPHQESSEQSVGGTTDDIAHSSSAFDGKDSNPYSSANKISNESGIDMRQSAANEKASKSPKATAAKKQADHTQK
ncbi:hypothetical protein O181_015976 [Austropuccinia psidii MF-1]|uniref:Uncharacterized protein n=1 Tax=Austropuccinia psidii MF-1 TaxID=1389203 RepID=A0A9Q3GQL6_9BASI|nr:hypothetical protein [Austropuccinia psidii MF-1]